MTTKDKQKIGFRIGNDQLEKMKFFYKLLKLKFQILYYIF